MRDFIGIEWTKRGRDITVEFRLTRLFAVLLYVGKSGVSVSIHTMLKWAWFRKIKDAA